VKEFLSQRGIPHTVKNIENDHGALRELVRLGFRSAPVTVIDGEPVVGFDRERLEELLAA